jgi:hypothetical protein
MALGFAHTPIEWVLRCSFPGIKQLDHEAEPSLPTIADVKKYASIHPIPIHLYGIVLSSAQGHFYLYEECRLLGCYAV